MTIKILSKAKFVEFLQVISRISDYLKVDLEGNKMSTVCATVDRNIILYTEFNSLEYTGEKTVLNFADIKRFSKAIESINEEQFIIELNSNNIVYKGESSKFKIHLVEDAVISRPNLTVDKIFNFEYNYTFSVKSDAITNLIRKQSLFSDINKVYIYQENKWLHCDITDNNKSNTDSFVMKMCEIGSDEAFQTPVPFNLDYFKVISCNKFTDATVKFNSIRGILLIEIISDDHKMYYITSALKS